MFRFVSALSRLNSGSVITVGRAFYARHFSISSTRYGSAGEGLHRTSPLDKKILVWTKRYPKLSDVPEEVTEVKMKKAKDVFRIRMSIAMALSTLGLCVVYVWSGKQAVQRGENIHQQNRDRHFEFNKKD